MTGHAVNDIQIRAAAPDDFEAIWEIFRHHLEAGETYPFDSMPRDAAHDYWLGAGVASYVAVLASGRVLGMYRLVPNQADRGAHVANASYMVSPAAQGVGVGKLMGAHSLLEARRLGYLAMQFNYVISTNTVAVALWKKLGFTIAATLPGAYRHKQLGYVDAYVMYQALDERANWPEPE
jgi:L-amino acid N-acyltransferase YncA